MPFIALYFALLAAALSVLMHEQYQENEKAKARKAKTRAELVPLLETLTKALDVQRVWLNTSRR